MVGVSQSPTSLSTKAVLGESGTIIAMVTWQVYHYPDQGPLVAPPIGREAPYSLASEGREYAGLQRK